MKALAQCALLLTMAWGLVACSALRGQGDGSQRLDGEVPAIYYGKLSCRDCPGVDYWLYLRKDGTYFQRHAFPGRRPADDIGRWYVSSDGAVLMLAGHRAEPDRFRIEAADRLLKLDALDRPLRPLPANTLRRLPAANAWLPELRLTGRYVYAAGRASFEDCRSGLTMPVEGPAAAAVEANYLDQRIAMRVPMLMTVHGRVHESTKEADAPVVLQALRFKPAWIPDDCPPLVKTVPLQQTRWRLVQLGAQPVAEVAGQKSPAIEIAAGGVLKVSTGCDDLSGRYTLRGDSLSFSGLGALGEGAGSCPGGAVLEIMLTDALRSTARWRQLGPVLELYGNDGTELARFTAGVD